MIDLVGKKFGLLTVVKYAGKPGTKHRWECKCKCGNSTTVQENHLKTNNTKSCGCLHKRSGNQSPFFRGYGEIPLDVYSTIQRNAKGGGKFKRKEKEFSISIKYLWKLFLSQDRKCALTGLPISFDGTRKENKKKETSKITASLDRIDSSKGYVKGNVQWVHKDVNIMKNSFDTTTFLKYCSLVHENRFRNDRQNAIPCG